jgi:hypothetical protein
VKNHAGTGPGSGAIDSFENHGLAGANTPGIQLAQKKVYNMVLVLPAINH